MKLDATALDYLSGKTFSNGHRFPVPWDPMVARNDLLVAMSAGKRVLHVGCADHLPLISEKRASNSYLHDLLVESAAQVTGLDTNAEALEAMRHLGISDLFFPGELPTGRTYDLVLAPDVIEHVNDVGQFLKGLKSFDAPVLVTTPNALRIQNRVEWRHEFINSDHRYWFSPYTLSKSMVEAGYRIESIWYTDSTPRWRPLRRLLAQRFPACRDGLAVLGRPD